MDLMFDELSAYANKFESQIQRILGPILIARFGGDEDLHRNTDLMSRSARVSLRVRSHEQGRRFPGEITVRCSMPSGAKTEIDKILDGYGDLYFYGVADNSNNWLESWILGSTTYLKAFLEEGIRKYGRDRFISQELGMKTARCSGCGFVAIKASDIPNFIIETSEDWELNNGPVWHKAANAKGFQETQYTLF